MTIKEAGERLDQKIKASETAPPKNTPLHITAEENMEMAVAYLSDGGSFVKTGDPVNALASYAYGLGWLDAGISTGLILCKNNPEIVLAECSCEIPDNLMYHLEEKTERYHRMLDSALRSVTPSPDSESPMHKAAKEIIEKALNHLEIGRYIMEDQNGCATAALWHFSYGYGWLDSGVRSGILVITGDRSLFTV